MSRVEIRSPWQAFGNAVEDFLKKKKNEIDWGNDPFVKLIEQAPALGLGNVSVNQYAYFSMAAKSKAVLPYPVDSTIFTKQGGYADGGNKV